MRQILPWQFDSARIVPYHADGDAQICGSLTLELLESLYSSAGTPIVPATDLLPTPRIGTYCVRPALPLHAQTSAIPRQVGGFPLQLKRHHETDPQSRFS